MGNLKNKRMFLWTIVILIIFLTLFFSKYISELLGISFWGVMNVFAVLLDDLGYKILYIPSIFTVSIMILTYFLYNNFNKNKKTIKDNLFSTLISIPLLFTLVLLVVPIIFFIILIVVL